MDPQRSAAFFKALIIVLKRKQANNVVAKEEITEYNCFYFKCSTYSSILQRMSFETFCF